MFDAIQSLIRALTDSIRPWIVLAPWEAGIRIRMGKKVRVLGPGFNWRIPGVDRISIQTTRLRVAALPAQTMTTHNPRQTLVVGANVSYSIKDIRQLYDSLHHAEDTIRCLASEAIAEAITEGGPLAPRDVADAASRLAAERLAKFGLGDVSINLVDFAFVRTYRLISDQRWSSAGDYLNLNAFATPSGTV